MKAQNSGLSMKKGKVMDGWSYTVSMFYLRKGERSEANIVKCYVLNRDGGTWYLLYQFLSILYA